MPQVPTALEILIPRVTWSEREEVEGEARGTAWSGTGSREDLTYTLAVKTHVKGTSQVPSTDVEIESTTNTTDKWGSASIFILSDKSGTGYRLGEDTLYYFHVTYTPTVGSAVTGVSEDFIILNAEDFLIFELEQNLSEFQTIPIRDIISPNRGGGTSYDFDPQLVPWNDSLIPTFRKNQTSDLSPSAVNYNTGTITLASSLVAGDEVMLKLGLFKFFAKTKLQVFVMQTVTELNLQKQYTEYSTTSWPDYWQGPIVVGAKVRALQDVILSMLFQDRRLIFGDEMARGVVQTELVSLINLYNTMLAQSKKRSMVTGGVVTSHEVVSPVRVTGTLWRRYLYGRGL